MKKLINSIAICLFVIVSLCGCNHMENKVNEINDAKYSSAELGAEIIVSNVELAYSTAYMLNDGNVPTVKDIAERFKVDGAKMDTKGNITVNDKNITCTTTNTNNKLKVSCKANGKLIETKTDMEIENN